MRTTAPNLLAIGILLAGCEALLPVSTARDSASADRPLSPDGGGEARADRRRDAGDAAHDRRLARARDLRRDVPGDRAATVPDAGCQPSTTLCGGACVDVQTDPNHCGGCNQPCAPDPQHPVADTCSGGTCVCGAAAGPCGAGLTCVAAVCTCTPGGLCTGCCSKDRQTCYPASTTTCGTGGTDCKNCDDGNPCSLDSCAGGSCASAPAPVTTPCDDGDPCTLGDHCSGGDTSCHLGGFLSCTLLDTPCTHGVCDKAVGGCVTMNNAPLSGCTIPFPGPQWGLCVGDTCCTGCIASGGCRPGDKAAFCGTGGAPCVDCVAVPSDTTCTTLGCL